MLITLRLSVLSRVVPPISHPSAVALFGSASAAAAVVGVIADTWPVARAPHNGETLRRCGAYNRRTKSTAPVSLKARVRHAFRSTRQSQRMNQLRSQHAMHVEVERVRKEKSCSSI